MNHINDNISHILDMMKLACHNANRNDNDVLLLCVSKTKPIADIIEAYNSGQRHFGESYVNEAVDKVNTLKQQGYNDIVWHFIGPIQSNKTKLIANNFDIVESVDRPKILKRLSEQRDPSLGSLDVLLQVNISNEDQKSGVAVNGLDDLIAYAQSLDNIKLRGLMGIAEDTLDKVVIKEQFMLLKSLFDKYKLKLDNFNILSMGMTHDLAQAIECGSTQIRIGTAIFGPRLYHKTV